MSLPRVQTFDTWADRDSGAYGLITEGAAQAPILHELEGCDSSYKSISDRIAKMRPQRWCIVRLVPVDGNELLLLDLERLQQFNKEPQE